MSVSRPRPVIPEGLPELLHSLSFSVIKERPKDIISFAADHFSQLFEEREQERRELAEQAKNKHEDYFQDADAYAWRAGYYDPEEWQVMPDLKLPKGSLYEKYGEQFRLVEDDEEERKRRSLEARTKIEDSSQTEEIVTETFAVQTSDEEKYQEKEVSSSYETTGESNNSQITNDKTSEEPILIKTEEVSDGYQRSQTTNESSNDQTSEEPIIIQTEEVSDGYQRSQTTNESSNDQTSEEPIIIQTEEVSDGYQRSQTTNDQTFEEPIHIQTEESEREESNNSQTNESEKEDTNDSKTNDTEELSSNPDSETVSMGSSGNLSTDDTV